MILHIDMDAFFASVEQRDDPSLLNKPVVICSNSKRSVVSTASYEARKFGIHSAMPLFKAKQKCSTLLIVPGNREKYKDNSIKIMNILYGFSPLVEQVSIDEAFLDISGCERLFGTPEQIGRKIKQEIRSQLSLTCSIGIAPLKFLAKIASDMKKPDGLTLIPYSKVREVIDTLPIKKVPGVGKHSLQQMKTLNIRTLGDIRQYPLEILTKKFGKGGRRLLELSRGMDSAAVDVHAKRKSISSETTLSHDIYTFEDVKKLLLDRSQTVGRQLRKKNLICSSVFIKLKFSDFSQITRSTTLESPICSTNDIFNTALVLYRKVRLKKKIRLAGVGVTSLKDKDLPFQLDLLAPESRTKKQWESVDSTVDAIMEKYGSRSVKKASLNSPSKKEEPS